jgi:hypothetical protein
VHRVNRKTNLLPESSVSHLSIMYFSSDKHHEIGESRQNILHTFARDFFWGLQTHDNVQPLYCAAGSRLLRGKFIRSPATCPL